MQKIHTPSFADIYDGFKKKGYVVLNSFPSISHIQLHITEHAPQIYIKNTALLLRIISIKITEKNKLSSINVGKVTLVT